MGDLNEKAGIQEFAYSKLNSFRTEAITGIQVCALLLVLPILLLVLSVPVFVFSVPFGFVFGVYSAINELLSILLDEDLLGDNPRKEYMVLESDNEKQDEVVGPSIRMTSPFLSWGSSGEFGNLEQLLTPEEPEKEETNDDELQGQFRQIEPGEFVIETMEMFEAVRNEGKVGIEYIQESMEEATSILPAVSSSVQGTVLDLERVKLLAVDYKIDDVPRLQTINEQLENDKPEKKKDDGLASFEVDIEHTMNTTMKVIPQNFEQMNTVEDVWNATYKSMYHE